MNYGYVKCGICVPELKVADVDFNVNEIIRGIDNASKSGVELLVFPELSIAGATIGDLVFTDTLLLGAKNGLKKIVDFSLDKEMLIFVGMPYRKDGLIYNVAVCVFNGQVLGIVPKSFLNNVNGFSENRYFAPCPVNNCYEELFENQVAFGGKIVFANTKDQNFKVAAEIGEDVFSIIPPSTYHSINGANIVVNLCAMPDIVGRREFIDKTVNAVSEKSGIGYILANAGSGESTTDGVFSGYGVLCENGKILQTTAPFKCGLTISEIDTSFIAYEKSKKFNQGFEREDGYEYVEFSIENKSENLTRKYSQTPFLPKTEDEFKKRAELILELQAQGLMKRVKHVNSKTLVLGLSGGLDSTLALIVCVKAMENLKRSLKDVVAVTMPCFGTTSRTYLNTIKLAKAFGVSLKKVDITKSVERHLKDIKHPEDLLDVTYENAQARERTQVIMDIANMTGGLVVGTGDLSELALGWATYNGDHMSNYGVNASVPKTLVRYLVKSYADNRRGNLKATLYDILDTPVSPELLPAKDGEISQKTEDLVGDYILHDFFLYCYIRYGFSPKKIYFVAKSTFKGKFTNAEILKWLKSFYRRYFAMQFKRSCLPDGVKVGNISLSPRGDLHMPSDAVNTLWQKELEDITD